MRTFFFAAWNWTPKFLKFLAAFVVLVALMWEATGIVQQMKMDRMIARYDMRVVDLRNLPAQPPAKHATKPVVFATASTNR